MNSERVKEILGKIHKARIAVYGDFCLDAYWVMDPGGSEISVETGLKAEAVSHQHYSPGGASNIVANLAALAPREILAIGILGDDLFGRELKRQLDNLKVNTSSLITQQKNFETYAFSKRITNEVEGPRIDFGTHNERSTQTDGKLLESIRHALQHFNILIFNQQIPSSITNDSFIQEVNTLFDDFNERPVLLDSRHYNEKFRNVCRKINDKELARLCGMDAGDFKGLTIGDIRNHIQQVYEGKPVFVTCGEKGIITMYSNGIYHTPGLQLMTRLDTVGAGDTTLSALACCLAAGINPEEAAVFANYAAAVTVQKLFTTGTASGDEIIAISLDPEYIYNPDLAEDITKARYVEGTEIEICNQDIIEKTGNIRHVLFDHDGTISTLRHGWSDIMKEMMIQSISGNKKRDIKLADRIERRVLEYIEMSTGVQTIFQMEMLVELVKEFGLIPEDEVLDKSGYKSIYNKRLLQMVDQRLSEAESDLKNRNVFKIRGVLDLLGELKSRGVSLYLASGTDWQDVQHEATLLGYAGFFEGRIYGATGDARHKRFVRGRKERV